MRGFTLIEVMVAVAVAALLLTGVAGASQASLQAARRQKEVRRSEMALHQALELLRFDWRARTALVPLPPPSVPGTQEIALWTCASGLAAGQPRLSGEVRYESSEQGLIRRESQWSLKLHSSPVKLEFLADDRWVSQPLPHARAMRVTLGSAAFVID